MTGLNPLRIVRVVGGRGHLACYLSHGGMGQRSSTTTAERVRAHRERLRSQGLRPVQIWVPDVRSPQFVEQAHLQAAAVAVSTHDVDDQAFIDAVSSDDE